MTVKELRRYRTVCAELDAIDKKLNGSKIHVRDSAQSASKHPYSLHSVPVEGMVYEHSSPYLLAKKQRLEAEKSCIEDFIWGISDKRVRDALEIYCLEPLNEDLDVPNWEDVADALGDGSTGHSIRMLVARFLEKNC